MTKAERSAPITLSATDRVAVIAGSGRLPENVIESLAALGHRAFVIVAKGEGTVAAARMASSYVELALEDFGRLVPLLKKERITHIVMAGGIARRPEWRRMRPTWSFLKVLGQFMSGLARGDNGVLAIVVNILEREGVKVVGAHEIVPDLLATEGTITRAVPTKADGRDLDAALVAARTIGAIDIGQAAIAVGGRVVALEGIEGTDGLLERMKALRQHGRIAGRKRGVIVKCAKPGQELRADLPTIGPATIEAAHAAGLAGVGVEAGRSLILDQDIVVRRADELGLFVIGLPRAAA